MARWQDEVDDLDNLTEEPWEQEDKDRLLHEVSLLYLRDPKAPLIRLLREAQETAFKNEPQKIHQISKVPSWLSRRIKTEMSPVDVMFLLVDSLVQQMTSQNQTLDLLFEAIDAQTERLESVEAELRQIKDRILGESKSESEPKLKSTDLQRPIILLVGLFPHQYSSVINHCRRNNIDTNFADIQFVPKEMKTVPDVCHFVILSQWAPSGWDDILRKRNKNKDSKDRIKIIHETQGLPMIALRIGECIKTIYSPHFTK